MAYTEGVVETDATDPEPTVTATKKITELTSVELATALDEERTKVVGRGHPCRCDLYEGRVRISRVVLTPRGSTMVELTDNEGAVIAGWVQPNWVRAM